MFLFFLIILWIEYDPSFDLFLHFVIDESLDSTSLVEDKTLNKLDGSREANYFFVESVIYMVLTVDQLAKYVFCLLNKTALLWE